MHKIVINKSHNPYWPSNHVSKYLFDNFGIDNAYQLSRHDHRLVEAVQYCIDNHLNTGNDGSRLKLVEINCDQYIVRDYDNSESVLTPDKLNWIKIGE